MLVRLEGERRYIVNANVQQSAVEHHVAEIAQRGYTIVADVLAPAEADTLRADLERIEHEQRIVPGNNPFEGYKTVRIYNLLARGECYASIPVAPQVLPIVEGVLDRGCLVSSLSSIAIGPGERAQMLHADDQVIALPRPHPPLVCNTMWALTDFTAENGATRIVPGSHRAPRCPNPAGDEEAEAGAIPAEMTKGSVLIWNGSLWHGGGANRTQQRRVGIAMNYCAGFIRQQENQQLGIPREIVRTFSPRLKELVGYGVYRGLIGHIDKHSPMGLLGDDDGLKTIWDR
jgi:ectoine hydroxylase-related dioxygenase (phytanoyl-CoA dioxygenase family)